MDVDVRGLVPVDVDVGGLVPVDVLSSSLSPVGLPSRPTPGPEVTASALDQETALRSTSSPAFPGLGLRALNSRRILSGQVAPRR